MEQLLSNISPCRRLVAAFAVAVGVLLTACGNEVIIPTTTPPALLAPTVAPTSAAAVSAPFATATAKATATQATAPTVAPLIAPTVMPTGAVTAPTTARPATAPPATAIGTARSAAVPATSIPAAPKLGAAGGGTDATRSACDLITKADVEAVLGVPVLMPPAGVPGAPVSPSGAGAPNDKASICIYVGQGKESDGVTISLGQPNPNDPVGTRPLTQASAGTALMPLSGVGDEAATDGRHLVITRKHGYTLLVIVEAKMGGDARSFDVGTRLARLGADRL